MAQRSDMQQIDAVAADVRKLEAQLRAAERQAQTFNSREGVLGRPLTDYSFLKQLADSFDPYMQFWATAADWQVGTTGCTHMWLDVPEACHAFCTNAVQNHWVCVCVVQVSDPVYASRLVVCC